MIVFLVRLLRENMGFKVPMVFGYTSTRMMLAAVTSLLISIFLGPRFIKKLYQLKIGQPIRQEECPRLGELHAWKKNTPTMGGVLILFAMLVAMFFWMDVTNIFTLILFVTTVFLGFLGGCDDWMKLKNQSSKGLSGKKKMMAQVFLASVIALYLLSPAVARWMQTGGWYQPPIVREERAKNATSAYPFPYQATTRDQTISLTNFASRIYLPFYKEPLIKFSGAFVLLGFLFIVFVITGSSNAVNLTDGLDGLAVGCLILVATCLAIIAFLSNNSEIARYLNILYIENSGEIAVYLSAFVGACLGFLWYNGHPAEIIMGDTGSLALGGIIGVSAVLLKRELLLAIVGGIFVAEALSVIVQVGSYKLRNKKRVFLCAPLHHHFEYKGWPETKVVIRFWIIGLLLAIIGMASLKFQ
ncbi:MAG: phospho-N-acetylmuramoyl-pentapeptide-transferase [Waddliaceae bacterium]